MKPVSSMQQYDLGSYTKFPNYSLAVKAVKETVSKITSEPTKADSSPREKVAFLKQRLLGKKLLRAIRHWSKWSVYVAPLRSVSPRWKSETMSTRSLDSVGRPIAVLRRKMTA